MKRREFLSYALTVPAAITASRVLAASGEQATSGTYDLILKNGRVLDGAGNPWFTADIAIQNGKIARIGRLGNATADKVLDVTGHYVSPGFIDMHSHTDTTPFQDHWVQSKIRQGITTDVNGQCGGSPAPLNEEMKARAGRGMRAENITWTTMGEYLDRLEQHKMAHNMAMFVGHGTVRQHVMGANQKTAPTAKQLDEMKGLVRTAMQQGACGLSTGLDYFPGVYAHIDEIVELAKVVAEFDGIYATHYRGFCSKVMGWSGANNDGLPAFAEAIEIGKRAGCRVEISHVIANVPISPWPDGRDRVRDMIYAARKDGLDIYCDILTSDWGAAVKWPARCAFPKQYFTDGPEKMVAKLADPAQRAALKKELQTTPLQEMGFEDYTLRLQYLRAGYGDGLWIFPGPNAHLKHTEYEQKHLGEIAKMMGSADLFDAYFDLILQEHENVWMVLKMMDDNIDSLVWPFAMPCTDGGAAELPGPESRPVRPSGYKAMPETLMWVRDKKLVTLEDMIRRMTSMPAHILRLQDRGLIREGYKADITVFDLDKVKSDCTYENGSRPAYPEGIPHVVVNGVLVVENNQTTKALPGAVLRHPSRMTT